jgi:hypothetical protein
VHVFIEYQAQAFLVQHDRVLEALTPN